MLDKLKKADCIVKLYVPNTVNGDQPSDNRMIADKIAALFSLLFGGATIHKAIGCYMNQNNKLIQEDIFQVYAFTTQDRLDSSIAEIIGTAENLKQELGQECIAMEINNGFYLI